jgi:hypothetical protein
VKKHRTAERRIEAQFRSVPSPASAKEHLRRLTLEPHIAGTKEDYDTAVYVRDQIRSYGIGADLREYKVWLPYPNCDSDCRAGHACTKTKASRDRSSVAAGSFVFALEHYASIQWLQRNR